MIPMVLPTVAVTVILPLFLNLERTDPPPEFVLVRLLRLVVTSGAYLEFIDDILDVCAGDALLW